MPYIIVAEETNYKLETRAHEILKSDGPRVFLVKRFN